MWSEGLVGRRVRLAAATAAAAAVVRLFEICVGALLSSF